MACRMRQPVQARVEACSPARLLAPDGYNADAFAAAQSFLSSFSIKEQRPGPPRCMTRNQEQTYDGAADAPQKRNKLPLPPPSRQPRCACASAGQYLPPFPLGPGAARLTEGQVEGASDTCEAELGAWDLRCRAQRTPRLRRLPGAPILEMPRSSAREADAGGCAGLRSTSTRRLDSWAPSPGHPTFPAKSATWHLWVAYRRTIYFQTAAGKFHKGACQS